MFILQNGDLIKVNPCRVMPYEKRKTSGDDLSSDTSFSDDTGTSEEKETESNDTGLSEEEVNDAISSRTRSHKVLSVDESPDEEDEMMKEERKDLKTDCVAAYYCNIQHKECLDEEISVHVVEVPVKEHGKPEVIEAKAAEIKNLESFGTFEEVADVGQSTIGSRWIITRKEAHDGQKKKCKGRIVARGFQEQEKPQSDSPTVLRASVKTFVAVAANEGFEICSIDITGAFLQAEDLDREVFVKPPVDIRKDGVI